MTTPLHTFIELVAYTTKQRSVVAVLEELFTYGTGGKYFPTMSEQIYGVFSSNGHCPCDPIELNDDLRGRARLAAVANTLHGLTLVYPDQCEMDADIVNAALSEIQWQNFPDNCLTVEYLLSELQDPAKTTSDVLYISQFSMVWALSKTSPRCLIDAALVFATAWQTHKEIQKTAPITEEWQRDRMDASAIMRELIDECIAADYAESIADSAKDYQDIDRLVKFLTSLKASDE